MAKSFQEEIKSNIEDERKKLMLNIIFTSNWINSLHNPIFKANGITDSQFNILRILKGSHPGYLSVGEIKNRIMFKQSDITRMMDRLVLKKLICREQCPDNKRQMNISISENGIELLLKINPEIDKVTKDNFQNNVSKIQATEINNLLDDIRNNKQ